MKRALEIIGRALRLVSCIFEILLYGPLPDDRENGVDLCGQGRKSWRVK